MGRRVGGAQEGTPEPVEVDLSESALPCERRTVEEPPHTVLLAGRRRHFRDASGRARANRELDEAVPIALWRVRDGPRVRDGCGSEPARRSRAEEQQGEGVAEALDELRLDLQHVVAGVWRIGLVGRLHHQALLAGIPRRLKGGLEGALRRRQVDALGVCELEVVGQRDEAPERGKGGRRAVRV